MRRRDVIVLGLPTPWKICCVWCHFSVYSRATSNQFADASPPARPPGRGRGRRVQPLEEVASSSPVLSSHWTRSLGLILRVALVHSPLTRC